MFAVISIEEYPNKEFPFNHKVVGKSKLGIIMEAPEWRHRPELIDSVNYICEFCKYNVPGFWCPISTNDDDESEPCSKTIGRNQYYK
jgi:hypothetical protein